jgi:hypothetical protein
MRYGDALKLTEELNFGNDSLVAACVEVTGGYGKRLIDRIIPGWVEDSVRKAVTAFPVQGRAFRGNERPPTARSDPFSGTV